MYVEIYTGFVMTRKQLRDIWVTEFDGGDDTNPVTFDEFLQGMYYETDSNGEFFPCYFEQI